MGKTYYKNSRRYDDDEGSGRSAKHPKYSHEPRRKGGMKTLNKFVEQYYEFDDSPFEDDVEINDNITIQQNTEDKS